jgi:Zn-dependent protease with chaperone function
MVTQTVTPRPRPAREVSEVLSATTMRFVLLTAAMVVTGLFVGVSLFNGLDSAAFLAAGRTCFATAVTGTTSSAAALSSARAVGPCMAPIEHRYALFAVGGVLMVVAGACVVVAVAPGIVARRHRLRAVGTVAGAASERLAEFCADVGIRRPPRLLIGPPSLRDAFCLGRPGSYAVAMPLALVVRPHTPLFDVVLRHELAHLRHHDVALSWLARSVWYALAPLLLLPAVLFVVTGDLPLLPGYLWRAAVLGAVVTLAARSALRSRELSADVAAARLAGSDAVRAALGGVRTGAAAPWRRILAVHPAPGDRIAALESPARTACLTAVDGAVVGFVVAAAQPVLDLFLVAVLAGNDPSGTTFVFVAAAVLAPLAGVTLGLGFWRQTVLGGSEPRAAWLVLLGLAGGTVAGRLSSVGATGLAGVGGVSHPALLLVVVGAMTGAAALTAGAATIWADSACRFTAAGATICGVLLFALALWVGDLVLGLLDLRGWPAVSLAEPTELSPPPVTLAAVILAAAVGWAQGHGSAPGGRTSPVPVPARESSLRVTLSVGVLAGLGPAVVVVGNRARLGDAADQAETVQRFIGNWWIAAAGAASAAVVLALCFGVRGWGAGLVAGPVAVAVAALSNLGLLFAINGFLPWGTITGTFAKDLALGLLVTLLAAAVVPAYGRPSDVRSAALPVALAALLSVGAGAGAALARDVLAVPFSGDTQPAAAASSTSSHPAGGTRGATRPVPSLTAADYKTVASILAEQRAGIQSQMDAIDHEPGSTETRVAEIDERLIPDLRRLLDQAATIRPADGPATEAHRHLLNSLALTLAGYRDLATGLADDNADALARGRMELAAEARELTSWDVAVSRL